MEAESGSAAKEAARKRAEARKSLIFGAIATAIIIFLIAVMMGIEIYGEKLNGELDVPANAADRS